MAALDDNDTAEMYTEILRSQIASVHGRAEMTRKRETMALDSETGLDILVSSCGNPMPNRLCSIGS